MGSALGTRDSTIQRCNAAEQPVTKGRIIVCNAALRRDDYYAMLTYGAAIGYRLMPLQGVGCWDDIDTQGAAIGL